MRSAGGTKSAPPCVVTFSTKSVIDFLTGPSFHDGSQSAAARALPHAMAPSDMASSAKKYRRETAGMLPRSRHSVLDGADNGGDERAGNAAADGLPGQRGDIDTAASRPLQHRQQ